MKNLLKFPIILSLTGVLFNSNFIFASEVEVEEVESLITLYNSSNQTVAVLRQHPRKIDFFSCTFYEGSPENRAEVKAFFDKGLDSKSKIRVNCVLLETLNSKDFSGSYRVFKTPIQGHMGVHRYIYTQSGAVDNFAEVWSEVAAWSIDVSDGLGYNPRETVDVTGTRIIHERSDNPTISSFRESFKFAGAALTKYPVIKK